MISDHKKEGRCQAPPIPKRQPQQPMARGERAELLNRSALQLTTGCKTKEKERKGGKKKKRDWGGSSALRGEMGGGKALGEGFPPLQLNTKAESIKGGTSQEFPRVFGGFFLQPENFHPGARREGGGKEAAKQQPRPAARACPPASIHARMHARDLFALQSKARQGGRAMQSSPARIALPGCVSLALPAGAAAARQRGLAKGLTKPAAGGAEDIAAQGGSG